MNEKSLTNLIEAYNRCKGEPSITFKVQKPWTKAIIGITGGVNISQLSFDGFDGNQGYEHLEGNFEASKAPIVGISLDVISPRISERISFHADLLYLSSKYYSYSLFKHSYITLRNYVTVELQQLKIPIGIRYTFPKRNVTPYFNVGISSTIHLNSSTSWIQDVQVNNVVGIEKGYAFVFKQAQFGLWGGCGVIKSISNKVNAFVELRYEQTNGVSYNATSSFLKSQVTNFQILIGIRTK